MGEGPSDDTIAALGFCSRIDQENVAVGGEYGADVDPGSAADDADVGEGAEPFYKDVCCE